MPRLEESDLSRIHPYERVLCRDIDSGILASYAIQRRFFDADSNAGIVNAVELRFDEVFCTTRVVVSVHVADDVCCRMGITSGHATCRLVVLDGRVERISLVTEGHFLKSRIVRIVSEYTDFVFTASSAYFFAFSGAA